MALRNTGGERMDPNHFQLARTLTDERLREAAATRRHRLTSVATPNRLQAWLRRLTGRVPRAARAWARRWATDGHETLVEREARGQL